MIYEMADKHVKLTLEHKEFNYIKKLIETTLKFWGECKLEFEELPWELLGEDLQDDLNSLDKETISKLKCIGIKTFDLEL